MDEQHEIIQTFSEMAPRYEKLMNNELNKFFGFDYGEFVSWLIDEIEMEPGETILDIATGTGFIPAYIQKNEKTYKKIIGLDITFEMLINSERNLGSSEKFEEVNLVCASAHAIPLKTREIDHVICCLATHHMDVDLLLKNIKHCLKEDGTIHLADAGGSLKWKNTIIKTVIKLLASIYFLIFENLSRARAESSAVANIHTTDEWRQLLTENGYNRIEIVELKSRRFWAPVLLIIKAKNNNKWRKNDNSCRVNSRRQ